MARASGREKSESGPAGRLFPAAFLRRPALGDGGPPAFLSKDSEETLMAAYPAPSLAARAPAGGGPPDLALGKVIHISEAQSELCAAYGLPAGSTYSVVTAEMLELQDPRSALLSHT